MVDWERLRSFSDGTEENLRELVTLYLDQTELQMNQIRSAIIAEDWVAVRKLSHSAAGSSGTCGLMGLSVHFKNVENALIEDRSGSVQALFGKVEKDIPNVFAEMRKFLEAAPAVAN